MLHNLYKEKVQFLYEFTLGFVLVRVAVSKCRYTCIVSHCKYRDYVSYQMTAVSSQPYLVAREYVKTSKTKNVATLLNRAKLMNLSSIVFHTVLVAREYVKTSKTKKCGYIAS